MTTGLVCSNAARATPGCHRYSVRNCLLILAQRPGATRVAGYRRWQELGRQVGGGEEAIRILAPVSRAVEDEGTGEKVRALVGFKVASVFDVSQTDGEPLPEAPRPEDLAPDDPAGIASMVYGGLSRFCEAEGVAVEMEDRRPGEYGSYERKERRVVLNRALSEVVRADPRAPPTAPRGRRRDYEGCQGDGDRGSFVRCVGLLRVRHVAVHLRLRSALRQGARDPQGGAESHPEGDTRAD